MRSYNPTVKGHPGQIKKAVQLLLEAKRPMVYTGGGVILADAVARSSPSSCKLLGFPCTNTLMGLGGYPATDPQFLGMLGMHGTYEANMAMQHCDVLLAIGARFDDRVIGNPTHFGPVPRKIIHVDIDPSSISKRVKVDVPIVGNVREVLDELLKLLDGQAGKVDQKALKAWWAQIDVWRAKDCLRYDRAAEDHQAAVRHREALRGDRRATRSSPPTSASTRCGRRSSTSSTSRAAGSTPAASARWASACPRRWARSSRTPARRSPASPASRAS